MTKDQGKSWEQIKFSNYTSRDSQISIQTHPTKENHILIQ